MPLRVLHLSTYAGGGGAARAASNVNKALQLAGVDSRIVTARGNRFKLARSADRALWKLQRSPVETWRSPAWFGSLTADRLNSSSADIVNLHWVTDGFLSIEEIGKINKPVVMSMYDMWPICGTEHYAADTLDARWRTGYRCDNRPSEESGFDIDLLAWRRKAQQWSGFHMIPASRWLEAATRESALCAEWQFSRIPHPVDETVFQQRDKTMARIKLGLDANTPTVGFLASAGIHDGRKGFDLLLSALRSLPSSLAGVQIAIVGPDTLRNALPNDLNLRTVGAFYGDDDLVSVYNAFDVLAVPSRLDNMPLTAMEAQMAGVPVVAFSIGGLPDIIRHRSTGYLAEAFDHQDFAKGLEHVIADLSTRQKMGVEARKHAITSWGYQTIGRQYVKVYEQVLAVRE